MNIPLIRILAVLLVCLIASVGCNQSNNAEMAKVKAEAEAAKAELARANARADAAEAELAPLKAAQAQAKVVATDFEKARTIVEQLGVKVEYDPNVPGQHVTSLDLRGRTELTNEGLASLKGFSELKVLRLGGGNFYNNDGLAHVAQLPKLEELAVNEGGGQITDAGFSHLAGLKSLKKVTFGAWSSVLGKGLEGLTGLETLDIAYAIADDTSLASIGKLTNLQNLRLDYNEKITDAGLMQLKGLTNLRYLGLVNVTQVTDKGLESLHGLKSLIALSLQGTKVSDQGILQFKTAVPGCAVGK